MRYSAFLLLIAALPGQLLCRAQDGTPAAGSAKAAPAATEASPEIAAIKVQSNAFVDAFNKRDAKAIAALWTVNAEYVDDAGAVHLGREAIEKAYSQMFADSPEMRIHVVIDSLRLLSDSVAIEDGRAVVDPPPAGAPGVSKYSAVHLKENGQWLMASVRDTWIDTPAIRRDTADLGWLIGSWVAEEQGVRMESTCRWVANEHFIERAFTTTQLDGTTSSGVQLIGWNPATETVQSWTFSADGGHAVGVWSMTTNGWITETIGVSGRGDSTSARIELRRLDDNAYAWQSSRRSVNGMDLPDTDEVVIRRVTAK